MILDEDPPITIPVTRASGPLTPSSSQSGSHRVYITDAGTTKRITRPVAEPPVPDDPLAGQPRAKTPTTIIRTGEAAAKEARMRLGDGFGWGRRERAQQVWGCKVHMTCTITTAEGRMVRVTIAGRHPQGCYFLAGETFFLGNFDGLWAMVTRQWPELQDATWAFAPFAQFNPTCWARVEAAYQQWGKKGA